MKPVDILLRTGPIRAIAVDDDGQVVAVAIDDERIEFFQIQNDRLVFVRSLELSRERYRNPDVTSLNLSDIELTFLNRETLLVSRILSRWTKPRTASLGSITQACLCRVDLRTDTVTHEYFEEWCDRNPRRPVVVGSQSILQATDMTVLLIEQSDLRLLARLRDVQEGDAFDESGEFTDEYICPGGLVLDADCNHFYVQWGCFGEVTLQKYRLMHVPPFFHPVHRFATCQWYRGGGLCRSPWDETVVAWRTIMDRRILPELCSEDGLPPETTELGQLEVVTDPAGNPLEPSISIPVFGLMRRDFLGGNQPERFPDADGVVHFKGYRIDVDYNDGPGVDRNRPRMFFADRKHVVLTTPSGASVCVALDTRTSVVLEDWNSPITARCFLAFRGLLLTGLQDGRLILSRQEQSI